MPKFEQFESGFACTWAYRFEEVEEGYSVASSHFPDFSSEHEVVVYVSQTKEVAVFALDQHRMMLRHLKSKLLNKISNNRDGHISVLLDKGPQTTREQHFRFAQLRATHLVVVDWTLVLDIHCARNRLQGSYAA